MRNIEVGAGAASGVKSMVQTLIPKKIKIETKKIKIKNRAKKIEKREKRIYFASAASKTSDPCSYPPEQ